MKTLFVSMAATLLLTACEDKAVEMTGRWTDDSLPSNMPVPLRWYKEGQVAAGAQLFVSSCAECHGRNAEGAPHWQAMGPDGKRPPPPLNGAGHAWHHSVGDLRGIFMSTDHGGTGDGMPRWQDTLSNPDTLAIVAWLQSLWPDEIYAKWHYKHHRDQWH